MTVGTDLKQTARALAAERRRDGHPEAVELAAYAGEALPAERQDEVQEHLASCAECARLLADFLDFDELSPPDGFERLTDVEVAAARRQLQRSIENRTVVAPSAAVRGPRWTGAFASPRPLQLLAAALAAAVIGLTFWGVSQQRNLHRLQLPEVNVATHDIEPLGSDQLRGGPATGPTVIDSAAGSAILILQLPEVQSHPAYRAAIRASDSREIWSRTGAVRDPVLGNFALRLPPGTLRPGRYEIEIFGVDGGREERVARYAIEVR
jgi:Putative zinc-finger